MLWLLQTNRHRCWSIFEPVFSFEGITWRAERHGAGHHQKHNSSALFFTFLFRLLWGNGNYHLFPLLSLKPPIFFCKSQAGELSRIFTASCKAPCSSRIYYTSKFFVLDKWHGERWHSMFWEVLHYTFRHTSPRLSYLGLSVYSPSPINIIRNYFLWCQNDDVEKYTNVLKSWAVCMILVIFLLIKSVYISKHCILLIGTQLFLRIGI